MINHPTSSRFNYFYRSLLLKPPSLISRHLEVDHVIWRWTEQQDERAHLNCIERSEAN